MQVSDLVNSDFSLSFYVYKMVELMVQASCQYYEDKMSYYMPALNSA